MKRFLLSVLSFGILAFIAALIGLFLIILFGFVEPASMHLGLFLGLTCSALINYLFRFNKADKSKLIKILLIQCSLFLVLAEIVILAVTPLDSVIREPLLINLHLITKVENNDICNINNKITKAEAFFGSRVDFSRVKIVYGGEVKTMSYFGKLFPPLIASTYGNFVYITDKQPCLTEDEFVHEFVHVWQYQHGIGLGPRWVPYWINYYWTYFTNFYALYDYGGGSGLISAKNSGKTFTDFGIEQQAMIVEDYYNLITANYDFYDYESLSVPGGYKALVYFVGQEFKTN